MANTERKLERRSFLKGTALLAAAGVLKPGSAMMKAEQEGASLTDDCGAVERMGMKVSLTKGTYENIKITTPVDLILGEAILRWREQE